MLEQPEVGIFYREYLEMEDTDRKSRPQWQKIIAKIKDRLLGSDIRFGAIFTLQNLLVGIAAIILSRAFLLNELLPFVFAYLAAFGYKSREKTVVITVCSCIGFLTVLNGFDLWTDMITIMILAVVMNNSKVSEERKWWGLPLLTVSVVLVAKSLMLMMPGNSTFFLHMIIVFEAVIAGILTFVFVSAGDVTRRQKPITAFGFEDMAAFIVLGTGIIMGLNDINIVGLSISSILCRLGVLIAAYLWGAGGATMVGVMAGIIPSISSSVFAETLGLYTLSGLLAGGFRHFGKLGIVIGFMLGNMALSMFIAQSQAVITGMWETIAATCVFFFLPGSWQEKIHFAFPGTGLLKKAAEDTSPVMDHHLQEATRNQIHHLANVFDELSLSFQESASTKPKPHASYLNYLYDELSHGFCEGCTRHYHCWEKDVYNTSQELLDIFTVAEGEGQAVYEECSETFKRKCVHGRELISTINYLFDNLRVNEYWSEQIDESRQLVSRQLKGVSKVVKDLAEEIRIDHRVDLELRDKVMKSCKKAGINVKEITPIRTPGDQLYFNVAAHACVDGTGCDLSIAPAVSSLLGEKLEVRGRKCPRLMGKGICEFTLNRTCNYRVKTASAQVAREEICGDTLSITTLNEGKQLVAISDGMGVGEKAAEESRTAIKLLENMIEAGFDTKTALKTINSVLLMRSEKTIFTTMDMFLIDLYTGDIDINKSASAPSFIKRGKQVALIRSSSLPLGIREEVDVASEQCVLNPKDMLVMVSDGVLDASREISGEDWIKRLLSDLAEDDPRIIADMIINQALSLCKGKPRDDMSVICLVLELN